MTNVFIDGKEGTTGLQIFDRLEKRDDVKIITLPEEKRKDLKARKECLNDADISFLCLPDQAAKEAVSLISNPNVKIIDASTAHRTNPEWVYGFPEISNARREMIYKSHRVANPGCYATGFISLVAPLIKGGIISNDYPLVAHAVSGYSGAGKKGIAQYEDSARSAEFDTPRQYALTQCHKHLPEMVKECGLKFAPIFNPSVCDFYNGMTVTVPIFGNLLNKKYSLDDIREYFTKYYASHNFVKVVKKEDTPDFIAANLLTGTNYLNVYVCGNDDRMVLVSVLDNLGKGASGAAVQNMNIMLGLDERTSLI